MPLDELPAKGPLLANTLPKPGLRLSRRLLRWLLLIIVPILVGLGGLYFYLQGGRYVGTDNAYVSAQKVLITPEVSGTVARISVREGQLLKPGDELFAIEQQPFELALRNAEAQLASVRMSFAGLKSDIGNLTTQIELARQAVSFHETELARKQTLVNQKVAAAANLDQIQIDLATARSALAALRQKKDSLLAQLSSNADLPIESYPPYEAALAARDKARWDLDRTVLRAPIMGIATQVSNIQLGRYLAAGMTVFAIMASEDIWVDANPKETDLTYVRPGQQVSISVDTFPSRTWRGEVTAISPGTGAQFSIIPPQNAAGNWVKVVQRVPVRVAFAPGQDLSGLRSGMSAYVSIDTRRQRTLAALLSGTAAAEPLPLQ